MALSRMDAGGIWEVSGKKPGTVADARISGPVPSRFLEVCCVKAEDEDADDFEFEDDEDDDFDDEEFDDEPGEEDDLDGFDDDDDGESDADDEDDE